MKTHKTFAGMAKAVELLIGELGGGPINDDRQYRTYNKHVTVILIELGSLWSNPADAEEAAKLHRRLNEAWYNATN